MRIKHILNLGAGVQSSTLLLMDVAGELVQWAGDFFAMCDPLAPDWPTVRAEILKSLDGRIHLFDAAIFADTQEEPRDVYDHLDYLKGRVEGRIPILTGTAGKLGDDLMRGIDSTHQRFAAIPAFVRHEDQREGRTKRQCTKEYKTAVIEEVIRRQVAGLAPRKHFPKDLLILQYLGLSFDEPGRIVSVKARYQSIRWSLPVFPLWEMQETRDGCRRILAELAPGRKIPRSACVCCPFRANGEWRELRDNHPEDFARACLIDETIRQPGVIANRGYQAPMYLHRSCVPLAEAPIDTPESRGEQHLFGFASECEGMCGV